MTGRGAKPPKVKFEKKMKRNDIVSASEIASWAWCPESWRLESLGLKPENQAALARGERRHALTALIERLSAIGIKLGIWLVVIGLLVAALAYFLMSER